MVSPGGGAGMKARSHDAIKAIMGTLLAEMKNFEPGTPEFNGCARAMTALNSVFGKPTAQDTMHAGAAQTQAMGRPGGPMPQAPPAGVGGPAPSLAPAGGARSPTGLPPPGMTGGGL
jgi:hypothetical protein